MEFDFIKYDTKEQDCIEKMKSMRNVVLVMVNSDSVPDKMEKVCEEIKQCDDLKNIPILGFAHKKHVTKMPPSMRFNLNDIILTPTGCEDILNRIDVWIKTYMVMNNQRVETWVEN